MFTFHGFDKNEPDGENEDVVTTIHHSRRVNGKYLDSTTSLTGRSFFGTRFTIQQLDW